MFVHSETALHCSAMQIQQRGQLVNVIQKCAADSSQKGYCICTQIFGSLCSLRFGINWPEDFKSYRSTANRWERQRCSVLVEHHGMENKKKTHLWRSLRILASFYNTASILSLCCCNFCQQKTFSNSRFFPSHSDTFHTILAGTKLFLLFLIPLHPKRHL